MKKNRLICTLLLTMAALILSCSMVFASQAAVDSDFGGYTYPDQYSDCLLLDGVDVSAWQGEDVDWTKVKRQGMDYAFIRIGYTSLDTFKRNVDSCFEINYQAAKDAGLLVGVYYYSCATTMKEAQQEAAFVLETLAERDLDLPVVFDFEYAGRIKDKYKTKAATTSNILAFLNYIDENSDYEPMFYSYRNITDPTWSPKFNVEMIDAKYKVWLAQYSTDIGYSRPMTFWQYTSSGEVKGISGNVDCNFWFYNNDAEVTTEGTINIKDADVTLGNTSYEYTRYQKKPVVKVSYMGTPLTKDVDYKLSYLKNVNAGTAYAMIKGIGAYSNTKLVPFEITQTDIGPGCEIGDIAPQRFGGTPVTVDPKVSYKGTTLKKGIDYTLSYENNTAPGTATVTVTGKRNYYGSFSTTFEIFKMQAKPSVTGETVINKEYISGPFPLGLTSNSTGAVTYMSSNPAIATIDASGTVTLTGTIGSVVLTMETAANAEYYGSTTNVTLNVTKLVNEISGVEPAYTVLTDVQPFTLSAWHKSTSPLTYVSGNPAVATVDAAGQIIVTGPGQTEITISAAEDAGYLAASKTVILTVNRTDAEIAQCIQNSTIKVSSKTAYGKVTLNWTKTGEEEVDYYEIFRTKTKNAFGSKRYAKTADALTLTYVNDKQLVKNQRYYYKVRGVKVIAGQKYYTQWSNVANRKYTYTGTGDIKIINGVKATTVKATSVRGKGFIKTSWKKTGGYKVDYYQVVRCASKDFSTAKSYFKTPTGKRLHYKDTKKLQKGKRYYYKVRGVRVVDGKKRFTQWSNVVTRIAK
ncbi:MAG: hypothetical protein IKJ77_09465 [Firmicutes bacterium]|nr:hypothetical protein [Bacillota bacterium]